MRFLGPDTCHYDGSEEYRILPCINSVSPNKIFCRQCFQIVTPKARAAWRVAFPYDVPYQIASKATHEDQAEMILQFQEHITFAKRQLMLF
jgi:hypothetical protein